jgi:serine/threonine protein kinase
MHDLGLYHRDLKPANIRFTRKFIPKLIDLGFVKTTNVIAGTFKYASPELRLIWNSQDVIKVDRLSPIHLASNDVWMLGGVLYYLFEGSLHNHSNLKPLFIDTPFQLR